MALLGLAGVAAGGAVLAQTELPEIDALQQSTFVCAADLPEGESCSNGNAMAVLKGDEDRVNVTYDQLSPHIINAVVAMEDRNFFQHDGVAPLAIGRALYRDLRGDAVQQGGSTITQQYVKNAFLSPERAITRKIKEAILAVKLEQRLSKEEILEGYLNTIYFGRGAYGIQAASQAYFGMDASALGIGESAYLAGLIRAPELADATQHLEEAERRRSTALVAMQEEGYITEDELTMADAQPFEEPWFRPRERRARMQMRRTAEHGGQYVAAYIEALLQEEPFNYTEEEIYGGGLRVYTSLDPAMQQQAWDAVQGVLGQPGDPAAALVAVDDMGLVRAMVGGQDFANQQVNYATAGRPVGSTFKPAALAAAVAEGYSLESTYDAPAEYTVDQSSLEGCANEWTLGNYAESEQGNLDLIEATAQSSNTAYAQLMVDVTPPTVTQMASRLGLPDEWGDQCPPVVLGTENASPLQLATMYSTFANGGVRKDPHIITKVERVDEEGNATTLYEWRPPAGERVLTPEQAALVTHSLQQVIEDGTGTAANIGRPAAGKTGTTSNNVDAWFAGYVPRLTATVWMGYPTPDWDDPATPEPTPVLRPMNESAGGAVRGRAVTGGSFPAEIWHDFMLAVTDTRQMNDLFPEVTEDQLAFGQRLDQRDGEGGDEGEGGEGDETTDTTGAPGNGNGNGNGNGPPTTMAPPQTSTSSSSSTSTSSTTTTTTGPPTTPSSTTTMFPPIPPPGRD